MVQRVQSVRVLRMNDEEGVDDSKWRAEVMSISTNDIVPGDIMFVPNNFQMPCDALILEGRCVVSESLLTGEATTVLKRAIDESDHEFAGKNG